VIFHSYHWIKKYRRYFFMIWIIIAYNYFTIFLITIIIIILYENYWENQEDILKAYLKRERQYLSWWSNLPILSISRFLKKNIIFIQTFLDFNIFLLYFFIFISIKSIIYSTFITIIFIHFTSIITIYFTLFSILNSF
jgi:hypothetical protein